MGEERLSVATVALAVKITTNMVGTNDRWGTCISFDNIHYPRTSHLLKTWRKKTESSFKSLLNTIWILAVLETVRCLFRIRSTLFGTGAAITLAMRAKRRSLKSIADENICLLLGFYTGFFCNCFEYSKSHICPVSLSQIYPFCEQPYLLLLSKVSRYFLVLLFGGNVRESEENWKGLENMEMVVYNTQGRSNSNKTRICKKISSLIETKIWKLFRSEVICCVGKFLTVLKLL